MDRFVHLYLFKINLSDVNRQKSSEKERVEVNSDQTKKEKRIEKTFFSVLYTPNFATILYFIFSACAKNDHIAMDFST